MMSADEFYEACNLTGNPFRTNPTYATDPRAEIWVGYERQQRQLLKYVKRTRADQVGNANFVVIHGTYGTGKSHALLWAQNYILHVGKDEFCSVCYFVPTLKKDKGKLTFAGSFRDDLVNRSTLVTDLGEYKTWLRTCLYRYRDANGLGSDVDDDEVLDRMIPPVELNSLIKQVFHDDNLRPLLAPKAMTDYQAMILFSRLANLFVYDMPIEGSQRRFKNAVYLFIDELDDLLRAPVREVREINDILRHLYDSCPNSFGLVVALSASIAELPALFEDYVLSRVQKMIALEMLEKDDAVKFVGEVLDRSRIHDGVSKPFFPFEESAVDAVISSLVEITPRKVVNTMQQVLEEVRLTGFDPAKGSISTSVLDDGDILEEVDL